MKKSRVDIVLPTFNGEKYIENQIKSILNQSYDNWRLLIRDDNSRDQTFKIILKYQNMYPDRIVIISNQEGNLGVTNNVIKILKSASSKYVMLCDQDDIWFFDKIKILVKCIKKKEIDGKPEPVLVYSDSVIVDADLKVISESFHRYSKLDYRKKYFTNILQTNIMQGASCIFNHELVKYINLPNIKRMNKDIYHDWWIALIACAFGKIYCYRKPLMYYRQHETNVLGAIQSPTFFEFIFTKNAKDREVFYKRNYLRINNELCKQMIKYYNERLTAEQKVLLSYYLKEPNNMIKFFLLRLYKYYSAEEIIFRIFIKIR